MQRVSKEQASGNVLVNYKLYEIDKLTKNEN